MDNKDAFPACFGSLDEFKTWRFFAVIAKERASPCSDCNKEFEARMGRMRRCHKEEVSQVFLVTARNKQTKPEETTKETV